MKLKSPLLCTQIALAVLFGGALSVAGRCLAEEPAVVSLGAGSYTTALPRGAKGPPAPVYKTDNVKGPLPTNQWWTSLLWTRFSQPQFPHPLAVRAREDGLQVYYPGPSITANRVGIFGELPPDGSDLVLGHSAVEKFPDTRLDGASDWFVRAAFAERSKRMRVSYGHGSPFVYAIFDEGQPRITFRKPPVVWSGSAEAATLGITIGQRHYGLLGPAGAHWQGLDSASLTCQTDKPYFSLAVLPDNQPDTLALFAKMAHAHVEDTRVDWRFDTAKSEVIADFIFKLHDYEGAAGETLFALYPHQWKHTDQPLLGAGYNSIRGRMKLARGAKFTTRLPYPGVLVVLPPLPDAERADLTEALAADLKQPAQGGSDTYWAGKRLGKLATLSPIAEQLGDTAAQGKFVGELKQRLEDWLSVLREGQKPAHGGDFYYEQKWGTLIGYPAAYGSDDQINDHHFHYGYFLKAAAEVARLEPAWGSDEQWGAMVNLLVRDIASGDRRDPMFPYLRAFDLYAGHSWASGHANFGSGNNQESSSEAMNAWAGLVLWGEATGRRELRDLGACLLATELAAINEYWFDVDGDNRPAAFTPSVATMIWGGKSVNETWFSNKPIAVHAINWIPFQAGSLYLGRYPKYVARNYRALVAETGRESWDQWSDTALMYRALDDGPAALALYQAQRGSLKMEAGCSRANLRHWLGNLAALGQVERDITADHPLYAVLRRGAVRTHLAHNLSDKPLEVRFSDGVKMTVAPKELGVLKTEVSKNETP